MKLLVQTLLIFRLVSSKVGYYFNTAAIPQKGCPAVSSLVCSGNGFCDKVDAASGQQIQSCPAGSATCRVYCRCEFGYGGQSCQYNSTQLAKVSSSRGAHCALIASADLKLSLSVSQMLALIQSFYLVAFNPYEIATTDDMNKCSAALNVISTALMLNSANSISILQVYTSTISSVVENLRLYTSVYNNNTEAAVALASNTLLAKMLIALKPGAAPLQLTANNLFVKVFYLPLHSTNNLLVQASPGVQSITLPSSGLSSCGYTGGYAQFSLIEWQTKPLVGSYITLNNMISFVPMNITNYGPTSSTSEPFLLTMRWAVSQNWSHSTPNCTLLGIGALGICPCKLITYTPLNATFSCPDVRILCKANPGHSLKPHSTPAVPVTVISTTSFGAVHISNTLGAYFAASSLPITLDYTSGTSFFSCFLFCMCVGIILFALWDAYEHTTFQMNRIVLEKAKIPPPKFTLKDAFSTSGVQGQSMASFRHRPTNGKLAENAHRHVKGARTQRDPAANTGDAPETGAFSRHGTIWDKLNQPVDLLKDDTNSVLYIQALLRHHSMLRMFTYGSLRVTRLLRFVSFCTDILLLIFITTAFYSNAFPIDNNCGTLRKYQTCLAEKSHWIDGDHLCVWDWPTLKCGLRKPEETAKYYAIAGTIVVIVSIVPLTLIKWAFEYVYTKEIVFALQAQSENETDTTRPQEEIFSVNPDGRLTSGGPEGPRFLKRSSTIRMSPEERMALERERRMKKVVSDVKNQIDSDEHVKNKVVIQHFVDEHLHPVESFFVRNHFFALDHAKPETLGVALWAFTLLVTVGLWFFFVVYIYKWTVGTEYHIIFAWGCTFIVAWGLKVFAFEFVGVFLMHVLPVVFLRNKLRGIYDLMAGTSGLESDVNGSGNTNTMDRRGDEKVEEGRGSEVDHTHTPSPQTKTNVRSLNPMTAPSMALDAASRGHSATAHIASHLGTNAVAKDAASIIQNIHQESITKLKEVKARKSIMGRRKSNWAWKSSLDMSGNPSRSSSIELPDGKGSVVEKYNLADQFPADKSDAGNSSPEVPDHEPEEKVVRGPASMSPKNMPPVPSAVRGHTRAQAKGLEKRTPPAKLSALQQLSDKSSGPGSAEIVSGKSSSRTSQIG